MGEPIPMEQQILTTMLDPAFYDMSVRPFGEGMILYINITLNTFRLLNMDQVEETIQFQNEFLMMWMDPGLGWNRSNYPEYSAIYVMAPEAQVFVPDVIYYSTIDSFPIVDPSIAYAIVRYDGWIRLSMPATVTVPCSLHLANFPYDEQKCKVTLGSWIFRDDQIVVLPTDGPLIKPDPPLALGQLGSITFTGNSEWELLSIDVSRDFMYIEDDGNYSLILYTVHLKRKPVYYVMVIQAPTLIIGTITIFGMFTPFSQRMERWQKVELGLNMLLAISMMLNLVSSMMPKAERLPLLGNYIIAEIFICSVGIIVSICILELHSRADQRNWRPPDLLCRLILFSCRKRSSPVALPDPPRLLPIKPPTEKETEDQHKLNVVKNQLSQTLHLVRSYMDRGHVEEEWRLLWTRIFDRLDIIFLVLFQVANIICSAMFMR
ncbi:unnamed protein product, partial [Mesorhabditis belari]|uniref:Neurotransmitter-gated ion-channel ligand-binding domain-containing protein n=1 Tax=Mesorhabditis belari TaxID=2138241 RepID=A0AAF3ECJ7_9BILA